MNLIARLLIPAQPAQATRAACQEHPNFWMYPCQ